MIRKLAKVLAWIVGSIVGLAVLAYLVLLAINWRDRPPSPTALLFEAEFRNRPRVADPDNAFVFLLGFDANPEDDPFAMGVKRKDWLVESQAQEKFDSKQDPVGSVYDHRSLRESDVAEFLAACRKAPTECADLMHSQPDVVRRWIQSEGLLRARYERLLGCTGWFEEVPHSLDVIIPSYSPAMDGQLLLLAEVMNLVAEGKLEQGKATLDRDFRLWRRVLASSDILISKMIAVAALTRNLEVGQGIIRQAAAKDIERLIPDAWREAMTETELSMHRVFVGEWIFSTRVVRDGLQRKQFLELGGEHPGMVAVIGERLAFSFFQEQDTKNRIAETLNQLGSTFDAPLEKYPEILAEQRETTGEQFSQVFTTSGVYNPVGRILIGIAAPAYAPYAVRVGDVEGVRRLVLVSLQLRSSSVEPAGVPASLAAHELKNPYTNEAFQWDEKEGVLSFEGLTEGERRFHRIKH